MKTALLAFVLGGLALGCRTEFIGEAHVSPAACQAKCGAANMRMTGMVFMGEYSSACICELASPTPTPMPPAPPPNSGPPGAGAGAAAGAAAAGVVMQMRQQEDQRHHGH